LGKLTPSRSAIAVAGLVAAKLALHLCTIGRYGLHRDELYLWACGRRLAWGSLDHAPLTPAVARLAAILFGDVAAAGQRVLPALSGAAVVWLTALAVRRLGGTLGAQLLAGACVLIAPVFLYASGVLGTNSFDQLFWTLGSYLLVRILSEERPVVWPWAALGLVVGLAILNKYTALIWAGAAALALPITPARRRVGWIGPAVAVVLALAVSAPNLAWQVSHGFPSLEFYRLHNQAARRGLTLWSVLADQPRLIHPLSFLVAMVGLAAALRRGAAPVQRLFGVIFVLVLGFILIARGKPYYIASAYPMLIAIGSVPCARALARLGRGARVALAAGVVVAGAVAFVGTLPVLPEPVAARLALHRFNRELIQFADWRGVAAQIARAHQAVGGGAGVLTDSYGTAAAIEAFGGALGLPAPASGANSYWGWGPPGDPDQTPDQTLAIGYSPELLAAIYRQVTPVGSVRAPTGLNNRFDFPRVIYLCRGKRLSLRAAWPRLEHFD
jgi:4-amino-4-deoxy-L-arabinose transferase-like glycosyltransferase